MHDFAEGHGLEIGPLHRPMIHRHEADVSYVDLRDREGLVAHYADPAHQVDLDAIPSIDYFLLHEDGRVLSVSEAVKAGAPFDWVVASHVVEHVPDLIGWLDDLAEVVHDGGALVLVVPDRRYTFDAHRPPTTVGQLLDAHFRGDTVPSVRAVYDHFSTAVQASALALWQGRPVDYSARVHSLSEAHERARQARDGVYVDCHVWMFTPDSFLQQLHELRRGGLSSWYVEAMAPTRPDEIEFSVRLRRLPRGLPTVGEVDGELVSTSDRPDWAETHHRRVELLEERLERLRGRASRRMHRIRVLRARLAEAQERAERARLAPADRRRSRWARLAGAVRRRGGAS
jgi:hypothetical protein